MKRLLALLCAFWCLLAGCAPIELAEPEPSSESETGGEETPEEPEGSKNLTVIFAGEIDDGRTDLLEAASQIADSKGYTLSTVVSMGSPKLEQRFLELACEAGEQAVLLELADPEQAAEAVQAAGEMAVILIDTPPAENSVLGKRVIFVGNAEGEGELYLRLTGRTAMRAAANLISGADAAEETELRLSGHKITVPADGILEQK